MITSTAQRANPAGDDDTNSNPIETKVTTKVTILGSTGSIGESTLDVIASHPRFEVFALSANDSVDKLLAQCRRFNPRYAVMVDPVAAESLQQQLFGSDCETTVKSGTEGLIEIASDPGAECVMAAIVGAAGLEATLAAVRQGKKILLANKESLVMAGDLFMTAVRESGATLLPIDSEHNAIFQCLPHEHNREKSLDDVRKVILTASGGPFLDTPTEQFDAITPEQACRHPTWEMGRKISVDSATLMNKGLEFIEACFLFGLNPNQVEVLIHPQSIVHSMVEYVDGSVVAQMATPDMRIPIAYGLAWPQRMKSGAEQLNLADSPALQFQQPDINRFPCLGLGMEVAQVKGTAPALLNAANEVAVEAFLEGRLKFTQIPIIIGKVLEKIPCEAALSLDTIQQADAQARQVGKDLIKKLTL
ncbi:MAG: 1-deoxy-D-xylulose-5-phosphate reductoisomerase [Pseudohongiellaceae bacterium]